MKKNKTKYVVKITTDESQILIFDNGQDKLISRISFYEDTKISKEEKLEMGNLLADKLPIKKDKLEVEWEERCDAFRQAYHIDLFNNRINKKTVAWLLNSILQISQEEAETRYNVAQSLISQPEFKDKEDIIIDKIYLSKENFGKL